MGIHWSQTSWFPSQRASNTVTVSKSWRHHESCFLRVLTLGSMAPISCVMGSLSNTSTMQSPPGTGVYTISLGCRYPTRPRFTVKLPWYMISKVCGWTAGQANSRHKPNAKNFIVMVGHPDGHSGDTWNKKEMIKVGYMYGYYVHFCILQNVLPCKRCYLLKEDKNIKIHSLYDIWSEFRNTIGPLALGNKEMHGGNKIPSPRQAKGKLCDWHKSWYL